MQQAVMRRCTRCVLPETFPKIVFDERGVCNYCLEYTRPSRDEDKEEKLGQIFLDLKNRGTKYDCVVPLSGGKDSTYTLHLIKKRYGLTPLAVTVNNHFRSKQADVNLFRALEELDVDHTMYTPRWSIMQRLYKRFFLNEDKGRYTSEFCIPCNILIWSTVNVIGEKTGLPVIYGGIREIEGSPPELFGFSTEYFKEIARDVLTDEEIEEFCPYKMDYRNASFADERSSIWIFDYFYWSREEERKALAELGWDRGSESISDIHMDCTLHDICNHFHKQKWGSVRTALHYSKMIRRGDMSRAEAMSLLEREEAKDVEPALQHFLERIGLSASQVLPPNTESGRE